MTCPKGLRNGPCGGTVDGACEVLPDQPCVWLNIRTKAYEESGLHTPWAQQLVGTSSLNNLITGADRKTRRVKAFTPTKPQKQPSLLAQRFDGSAPVITYEITSPRTRQGLSRVEQTVQCLHGLVDGINTTTNAGGVPSLHSLETARIVAAAGIPPIVQFCGRDHTEADFTQAANDALRDGFANILALTGDWNPSTQRERDPKHWFPMDSLQMVDILERADGFVKQPFIGVASNPYTTPMDISVARLLSKFRAGADFNQTQALTEVAVFSQWLDHVRATPEGARAKILASVPLVGKRRPFEILCRLPGVIVDDAFRSRLIDSDDLAVAGYDAALEVTRNLLALDIDGIHLMNFGMPLDLVVAFIEALPELSSHRAA